MPNHIEISRIQGSKFPQTISCCLICGEASSISDCADAKARKNNVSWFTNRHEPCAAIYNERKFPHKNNQNDAV